MEKFNYDGSKNFISKLKEVKRFQYDWPQDDSNVNYVIFEFDGNVFHIKSYSKFEDDKFKQSDIEIYNEKDFERYVEKHEILIKRGQFCTIS